MKPLHHFKLAFITIMYFTHHHSCRAKILRNSALMTKMMSHFQKDNNIETDTDAPEPSEEPQKLLSVMQSVLCKNFPSIPCSLITQDDMLKKLMERSIQQIAYKKLRLDKTTQPPGYEITVSPLVNSEDLSSFLRVSNTGYFKKDKLQSKNKRKKNQNSLTLKNFWSHEQSPKNTIKGQLDNKRPEVYTARKKLRKFYPHKVKHKDKNSKKGDNYREYSDEKLSMSVEVPDMAANRRTAGQHLTYKVEANDPPVWRIDYMKHGEPSLNMFAMGEERLRGKIMQTGPSVIVDENVLEQSPRKEVLHPDVYIKKKFSRKGPVNVNSDGVD